MCQEVEVFTGMEGDIDWFLRRVAQFIGPLKKKKRRFERKRHQQKKDRTKAQVLSGGLLSVSFGLVPKS